MANFVTDLYFGPWFIGATRLNASGTLVWFETVIDNLESLHATTAAGGPNRLYIAGSVNTHGTYVTGLSAPTGDQLWDRQFDFAPGEDERVTASATDPAGNLAVLVQGEPGFRYG